VAVLPTWAPGVDTSFGAAPNTSLTDMPLVAVTATFDHPDARSCTNRLANEDAEMPEPDPAQTVLLCRMRLVVTSMREIDR